MTPEGHRLLATEVPADMIARLDAHAERARRATPHQRITRSALVRHLLAQGLDALDDQLKRPAP